MPLFNAYYLDKLHKMIDTFELIQKQEQKELDRAHDQHDQSGIERYTNKVKMTQENIDALKELINL